MAETEETPLGAWCIHVTPLLSHPPPRSQHLHYLLRAPRMYNLQTAVSYVIHIAAAFMVMSPIENVFRNMDWPQ